jgi:EpsI family protein
MTATRPLIVAGCMLATSLYLALGTEAEGLPLRERLPDFPLAVGGWHGQIGSSLDDRIVGKLGVDDYVNRVYVDPNGVPVGLYVGYHQNQREGNTIHSPLNCLPGSGWEPVRRERISLTAAKQAVSPPEINRLTIRKGIDRQVVLYWYQSHGRVIASEYAGKFYLVLDAVRLNRTDGGFVRILSPVITSEEDAERHAVAFANTVFPVLGRFLPL